MHCRPCGYPRLDTAEPGGVEDRSGARRSRHGEDWLQYPRVCEEDAVGLGCISDGYASGVYAGVGMDMGMVRSSQWVCGLVRVVSVALWQW